MNVISVQRKLTQTGLSRLYTITASESPASASMIQDIPEADWAKFKCSGALPDALQSVSTAIRKEWLPGNKEYEINGDINIEWYSNGGLPSDADYQSAIWISVKKNAE